MGHSKSQTSGGIDENLKKVFQSTLEEDIPDRFKNLLEQLRTQESDTSGQEERK
ncbi:NepR family anti-sigma factor [Pseudooceanicola algae]|uniref:NepR family anti-sigma factor n=1 Tax=Pseudooceanicola algae TaxID=1537215 RepID=UPI0018AD1F84|nr:NepR family anti-sigma factor [Pseudooceanicola algae]